MTYSFRAQQYGTIWYHSHFSVVDGLSGPIIIHGPATADHDEHLGALFLADWSHTNVFETWETCGKYGCFTAVPNVLINGTNTFDCTDSLGPACRGTGKHFELSFTPGTKYRISLVETQADGYLQFAIDGHSLTINVNDLILVVPDVTDSIVLGAGQRYDVIVEADQPINNYWLRSIMEPCNVILNGVWNNIREIVRYVGVTNTTADPTSTQSGIPYSCYDPALTSLALWLAKSVGSAVSEDELDDNWYFDLEEGFLHHWTINSQALAIDWEELTLKLVGEGSISSRLIIIFGRSRL